MVFQTTKAATSKQALSNIKYLGRITNYISKICRSSERVVKARMPAQIKQSTHPVRRSSERILATALIL